DHVAVWAADNPLKSQQTPLDHRMMMLDLVVQEIQWQYPHVVLYADLSQSRTLHTLERARRRWPHPTAFDLVVGSDLVAQLPRWHRIEDLLAQVRLLIVPRPGYDIEAEDLATLQQLGGDYRLADLDPPAVSSTCYREKGDRTMITPPVAAYIAQQQLYAS
ncbi:MAG: nicotinate-nucleotide adenylyltransferase, partial [Spirulina sp. DLM2.Bin59]